MVTVTAIPMARDTNIIKARFGQETKDDDDEDEALETTLAVADDVGSSGVVVDDDDDFTPLGRGGEIVDRVATLETTCFSLFAMEGGSGTTSSSSFFFVLSLSALGDEMELILAARAATGATTVASFGDVTVADACLFGAVAAAPCCLERFVADEDESSSAAAVTSSRGRLFFGDDEAAGTLSSVAFRVVRPMVVVFIEEKTKKVDEGDD
jgi:hypothetical protein